MKNCYPLKGVLFQLNMEMERTWNSVDTLPHKKHKIFVYYGTSFFVLTHSV